MDLPETINKIKQLRSTLRGVDKTAFFSEGKNVFYKIGDEVLTELINSLERINNEDKFSKTESNVKSANLEDSRDLPEKSFTKQAMNQLRLGELLTSQSTAKFGS